MLKLSTQFFSSYFNAEEVASEDKITAELFLNMKEFLKNAEEAFISLITL